MHKPQASPPEPDAWLRTEVDSDSEPANDGGPDSATPPLTPYQSGLVEEVLPSILRCAQQVARALRGLVEPGELLAPGTFGAMVAAQRYDRGRHPSFPHFARDYIIGRMFNSVRAEHFTKRARVELAMERAYYRFVTNQVLDLDFHRDPEEKLVDSSRQGCVEAVAATLLGAVVEAERMSPEDAIVHRVSLRQALTRLEPRELRVISLVYAKGLSHADAAEEIGVHENTVQSDHASAIRKLRELLLEPEQARRR